MKLLFYQLETKLNRLIKIMYKVTEKPETSATDSEEEDKDLPW